MAERGASYGTFHTTLDTIKHSALPSWSGFDFQGHCAIFHAVKLLNLNQDEVEGYYLSIESFEDFAIMDASENIVSLHQCKCYSKESDFTEECQKISDKREYYSKELNKCSEDVPCYFHSNIKPSKDLVCDVKAYEFQPGMTTCDPDMIIDLFINEVKEYLVKHGCSGPEDAKAYHLMSMIQRRVAEIHQLKQASKDNFWQIATNRENWIPFIEIISKLKEPINVVHSDILRAITARNAINRHLSRNLEEDRDGVDGDYSAKAFSVRQFLDSLNSFNNEDLVKVIKRLNPHVEWNETCTTQLESEEKGNNLYKLLTSTKELADYSSISWNEGGILETPSTLGRDRKPTHQAESIRKNPAVLAFLRDYRWIVGDVDYPIDDIYDEAPSITDVNNSHGFDLITRSSRLGLLSIEKKNDSRYEKDHS